MQSQFVITECNLFTDRLGDEFVDLTQMIIELSFEESIYEMCIYGEISILDDKGFFDKLNFQGTERLEITIASTTQSLEPAVQKVFLMNSIKKESKGSNSQTVYTFSLIEEHGILSSTQKLRNSYRGSISDIIQKIAITYLKKNIDTSYTGELETVQNNLRVIIPNLNPIKCIKWLLSRMTTTTGSPYFVWSTVQDSNLRFGNLDTMYTQKPWNEKLPYTFNPANISTAEEGTEFEKSFIVNEIFPGSSSNLLKTILEGHYGANQETTNLNTGQIERRHYSIFNTLVGLHNQKTIEILNQNIYDDVYTVDNKTLGDYDAQNIHSVMSTGVYGDFKSYHDEFDKSLLTKKLERESINNLLLKNTYLLGVPGNGFFMGKAAVGDTVNLKIVNSNLDVGENTGEDNLTDRKKSGKHLITQLKHIFQGSRHKSVMEVAKLEREV